MIKINEEIEKNNINRKKIENLVTELSEKNGELTQENNQLVDKINQEIEIKRGKERKRKEIFLKRKRFCSFLRVRARALWRSQPAAKPAPRSSARGRGLSSQQPAAARFSCKIR